MILRTVATFVSAIFILAGCVTNPQKASSYNDSVAQYETWARAAALDAKNPDGWQKIKDNLKYSQMLAANINSLDFVSKQFVKNDAVDRLVLSSKGLRETLLNNAGECFEAHDHISRGDFFAVYPVEIKDKLSIIDNDSLSEKLSGYSIKEKGQFVGMYGNQFNLPALEQARLDVRNWVLKETKSRHKKITAYEIPELDSALTSVGVSRALVGLRDTPRVILVANGLGDSFSSASQFSLGGQALPFNMVKSYQARAFDVILVPKGRPALRKNVLKAKSEYSSTQVGTKLVPNSAYTAALNRVVEGRQRLLQAQNNLTQLQAAQRMQGISNSYGAPATKGAALMSAFQQMAAVQFDAQATQELNAAQMDLQSAEIDLSNTPQQIESPVYAKYPVKINEVAVEKSLNVDVYVKKSFDSGFYKYSGRLADTDRFEIISGARKGDQAMVNRHNASVAKWDRFKDAPMRVNVDLDQFKKSLKYRGFVKSAPHDRP